MMQTCQLRFRSREKLRGRTKPPRAALRALGSGAVVTGYLMLILAAVVKQP